MLSDAENHLQLQHTCCCDPGRSENICTGVKSVIAPAQFKQMFELGGKTVAGFGIQHERRRKNIITPQKHDHLICFHTFLTHAHTQSQIYIWITSSILPSIITLQQDQRAGSSSGLAHNRWRWWWDCCWIWAELCVWDLPAKVGQKGTPTASLCLIPCMALLGSLGSASSFSQE